ncbi:MAG TPA: hemerythrin domain-containing protein [Bacteroidota bacterium]|nr:hemerythrin domain-containing protein [Bacteroidota bacterium]
MNVTAELTREHDAILVALNILERICERIDAGDTFPADDVARVLDFFRTFADGCHHAKEEQHLFPALTAAGLPAEGGPVGVMLAEHDLGRKFIREMVSALGGPDMPPSPEQFARSARAYANLLRAHIMKENMVLFPMAENVILAETKSRLVEAFARLEEEKAGAAVHEQYHAMLHELSRVYASEVHHED